MPWLLHIPGLVEKFFSGHKAFSALLDELVMEHRMTWDPAQPPRDLTDAFLAKIEKVRAWVLGELQTSETSASPRKQGWS